MRLTILTAILLLLVTLPSTVEAQGSGAIEGQVFDGSSDGGPLEGLPVTLWAFADQEPKSSFQTTTDEEGRFRFEGLDTEGYTYQFEVEYAGVQYGSKVVAFPEGEDLISIPFTVYESTTSDEDLSLERAHIIINFEPGAIQVQEVQILRNAGNRTYIGPTGEEGEATVQFSLPQGASGTQLLEGFMECCVVETDAGFATTRPVFPGSKQFVFTYQLLYESTVYDLSREIAYPTRSLDVLVADVGVEVTAPGLARDEPLSLQDGNYLHLTAQDLTPADSIVLDLSNLPLDTQAPPPASAQTASPLLTWGVLGLLGLGAFIALAYPFSRRGREERG
jgi:hypothetical protein